MPAMRTEEYKAMVAELSGLSPAFGGHSDCNLLLMNMARYLVTTFPDINK